jgi:hypothetical protein
MENCKMDPRTKTFSVDSDLEASGIIGEWFGGAVNLMYQMTALDYPNTLGITDSEILKSGDRRGGTIGSPLTGVVLEGPVTTKQTRTVISQDDCHGKLVSIQDISVTDLNSSPQSAGARR